MSLVDENRFSSNLSTGQRNLDSLVNFKMLFCTILFSYSIIFSHCILCWEIFIPLPNYVEFINKLGQNFTML